MKILILSALAVSQPVAAQPSLETALEAMPLSQIHKRDIGCVAALAIVASEQEKAVEAALDYPLVSERGRIYAGIIGERVMAETGQSREQVRDAIVAALAEQQAKGRDAADPDAVVAAAMAKCLPLLKNEVPPTPKPTLNQCAAMLQLAYEEVYAREKLSKKAQDLKTLAFVLDNRAREQMRAEGKSGTESDIILSQAREEMLTKEKLAKGQTLDIDHCFKLAAPKPKVIPNDH